MHIKTLQKIIGFPFAILYAIVTELRNILFDKGILKEHVSKIPTIGVGNLSVGGTGKTPHVAYLITLLQEHYKVATLSMGYKRKTKGFVLASKKTTAEEIGDEPCMYAKKYPHILVAVDEKRVHGVETLSNLQSAPQIILLDDAFQHRYLKPNFSILLTDYSNPYFSDCILPSGMLRERRSGAKRANVIIVTKTPPDCPISEREKFALKLNPKDYQQVFFSFIKYGNPIALTQKAQAIAYSNFDSVLGLSGIANPKPFFKHLLSFSKEVIPMKFPDHYAFNLGDIEKIKQSFSKIASNSKAIFTTEKDFMRLQKILHEFENIPVFYIPIEIVFFEKERFDNLIFGILNK